MSSSNQSVVSRVHVESILRLLGIVSSRGFAVRIVCGLSPPQYCCFLSPYSSWKYRHYLRERMQLDVPGNWNYLQSLEWDAIGEF